MFTLRFYHGESELEMRCCLPPISHLHFISLSLFSLKLCRRQLNRSLLFYNNPAFRKLIR